MANRRFEMHEHRHVIHRMRLGESDRAIAKSGLMGRLKCAQLREVTIRHGWLGDGPLPVDAAAAALVSHPRHFQVIVTENLFGDILSDLGGATIGGLGMCPSANIGERGAYFEPIHGSAPDIAGRSLANPVSQIMSAAMMLDHLGEVKAAAMIEAALWKVYAQHGIPFKAGGAVEGGASIVATAVKLALKAF